MTDAVVDAALDDWRTAPVSENVRAMLCVLEKVTLTPAQVTKDDMLPLLALGISPQAIEDALVVGSLFNIIDRMADSLDVSIPTREEFSLTGERLLQHGYV